jgi:hypothetical protein
MHDSLLVCGGDPAAICRASIAFFEPERRAVHLLAECPAFEEFREEVRRAAVRVDVVPRARWDD